MPEARIRPRRRVVWTNRVWRIVATGRCAPAGRKGYGTSILAGSLTLWLSFQPPATAQEPLRPERARLETIVKTLTAPEMEGRRGAGARKAAAFLIDEFKRLRLEPLFDGRYEQRIPTQDRNGILGANVGGLLRGSDPALSEQYVIVSAHYDHLGKRGEVVYPGADDNASGVAMMLEVARALAGSPSPPRRSVIIIGFDLEEVGLFGSRYYVAHPPVPLEKVSLFITADMIGRALAGVCDRHVFVMGTENAPGIRPWIEDAARDQPVDIGVLGADLLLLSRSDYGPFRGRRVPFVFFSTGENPLYHSPRDAAETLDFPKLTAISRVIHGLTVAAANAPEVPRWSETPDNPLAEAVTIRDVMRKLVEKRETLKLGSVQLFLMNRTLVSLDAIVARGAITSDERANVIQAARLVLLMIQ